MKQGEKPMASTATITDLVKATANIASVGYDIMMQAGRFMESMQKSKESGQSKKDWVMTKMREVILSGIEGQDRWAEWEQKLSSFIDSIKTLWNIVTGRK